MPAFAQSGVIFGGCHVINLNRVFRQDLLVVYRTAGILEKLYAESWWLTSWIIIDLFYYSWQATSQLEWNRVYNYLAATRLLRLSCRLSASLVFQLQFINVSTIFWFYTYVITVTSYLLIYQQIICLVELGLSRFMTTY